MEKIVHDWLYALMWVKKEIEWGFRCLTLFKTSVHTHWTHKRFYIIKIKNISWFDEFKNVQNIAKDTVFVPWTG